MTAFQPMYGQLANIFGRRYPLLISVAIFAIGSGLCGGANGLGMMIAGRTIQGIGGAGVNVLVELIICDLVPLRERGKFMGIIFGAMAVGTSLGPVFAGLIVQYSSWRWVFYFNLPIAGASMILLLLFLHLEHNRKDGIWKNIMRIDFVGNAIFVAASISSLIALAWAGTIYPWSSFRVIVPLVLGFFGYCIFLLHQGSKYVTEPTMPLHLFQNRTSLVAFLLTFLHGITTVFVLYFLPVYFQSVLQSSPSRSGVQLLPTVFIMIPFAGLGGKLLQLFGQYKPIHFAGFGLMAIGFGLLSLLDVHSSVAEWVVYQAVESAGAGLVAAALLPAVQVRLAEADSASSTATWGFVRSLGLVWGSVVPSTVFNNRFDQLAYRIGDVSVRSALKNGHAYEHATQAFVKALPVQGGVREEVIGVFSDSLKRVWQVGIAFAMLGFVMVFFEEKVKLRDTLETEYGMRESTPKAAGEGEPGAEIPDNEK
jgi:MFS family permease